MAKIYEIKFVQFNIQIIRLIISIIKFYSNNHMTQ